MRDGCANEDARHDGVSEAETHVREVEPPAAYGAEGAVGVFLHDELERAQSEFDARHDAEEGGDDREDDAMAEGGLEPQPVEERDGHEGGLGDQEEGYNEELGFVVPEVVIESGQPGEDFGVGYGDFGGGVGDGGVIAWGRRVGGARLRDSAELGIGFGADARGFFVQGGLCCRRRLGVRAVVGLVVKDHAEGV